MASCKLTCTFLLALSVSLLCVTLIVTKEDVEVRQCKRHCRRQMQFGGLEGRRARELCETECETKLENENPYVFLDDDFTTLFKTQEGNVKVLPSFTERSQRLFKGIEDIRMLILEANPETFVIPSHWDSDIFFFVAQGRGTITLVLWEKIESFNIEKGHLMTIPAGTTFYMINRDDNEKLVLTGFVKPIANPGNFASFFDVGGLDPESLYHAFSSDLLEALFNTSSYRLQNFFSKQRKGVILKASKDQIKGLTAEEPLGSNYCSKQYGPCQILSHNTESTEFGKIFMVTPTEYVILQDLDMYVSFSITSQGCMNSPLYSTRVTKIIMVIKGSGRLEMACPQYAESSSGIHYKKISAELRLGMVFVVPPGYPLILLASQEESLC